jgi:large subunit ribosomal protein L24
MAAPKTRNIRRGAAATKATRIRIKKNDTVKVIAGKDKGKTGRVLEVVRDKGKLLVQGVSMIKRHTRPNPSKQIKGGIAEKESLINASNVMVLTSGGVTTRVGYKVEEVGGKTRRTRIARKTGEALDKKA